MAAILVISTVVLFAVFAVVGIVFAWTVWFNSRPVKSAVR